MASIKEVFNTKLTENGDLAYTTTGNNLLDILFLTEYFTKHLDQVSIGDSEKEKLFAMFIRDPRFGIGRRNLGRKLLKDTKAAFNAIAKCGRYDDIWEMFLDDKEMFGEAIAFLRHEIESGNELAKKWMPRFGSKNKAIASRIAKAWNMNKQQYGKFVKSATTEQKLTLHNEDDIKFEQVPSLAAIKYANAFSKKETTKERYAKYLEDVKAGKKELKVTTTTPYDIFKNANKIDADLFFDKLEKIQINALAVVDTSGSMWNSNDSSSKAMAIGHYIAKCSTFMPNYVISFSSRPQLIELGVTKPRREYGYYENNMPNTNTKYGREIASMYTGDCSSTNLGLVMKMLQEVDKEEMPEYLVVLSDMEFDEGSSQSREEIENLWKVNGYTTKIVWWNFNSRNITVPEQDGNGNIYMSGYNATLLKFLESGFDGNKFLNKLLEEYKKFIKD